MKALLDTHVFLWMAVQPERLSPAAREACETGDLLLSVASVWEIGVKWQCGKLALPASPRELMGRYLRLAAVSLLPIHVRHALKASELAFIHRDPFDRMLAAQSMEEGLPIISADPVMREYGAAVIWD